MKPAPNWLRIADVQIRPDDLVAGFAAWQIQKALAPKRAVLIRGVNDDYFSDDSGSFAVAIRW